MTLVQELERLIFGANLLLERSPGAPPPFAWLAEELRRVYVTHGVTGIAIRVLADRGVEVDHVSGAPRILVVAAGRRTWELAATVNAATPAQIAAILANP
jgi:hypothetical protein